MRNYLYKILTMKDIPSKLLNVGEKIEYKKNNILSDQDDYLDGAYILLKGYIIVKRISNNGEQIIRFILTPPCIIGEIYAITDRKTHSIFQFIEDSEVLHISSEKIKSLIKKDDEIFKYIFKSLSKKIKIFTIQNEKGKLLSVDIKVAILLYEFAKEFGEKYGGHTKINFNLTYELIGELIGIKRSTVIRAIDKLIEEDIISHTKTIFIVRDLDRLSYYIDSNS